LDLQKRIRSLERELQSLEEHESLVALSSSHAADAAR
jgi:hypothetical protein